jgi:16S rRNA U516 pseudouridylate synthase RsuA-like enzyme
MQKRDLMAWEIKDGKNRQVRELLNVITLTAILFCGSQ